MLERLFHLRQKNTNIRTEFVAGLTTFLTMAYIIFVNPAILSQAGMDHAALVAVTCIVSAMATIAVGIFANAPIAMAPGMGLNAFFTYSLVKTENLHWQTALAVVFLSGLFFLGLTILGLRKKLVNAIPQSLIAAIAVGIGLFITFIGLQNLGVIVDSPATLVQAAPVNSTILIGLAGLLVMIFLEMKRFTGALLIGIAIATAIALVFGKVQLPQSIIAKDIAISQIAFKLDIAGALKLSLFPAIFTLMFIDMFDSIGTLMACARPAGLIKDDGKIENIDRLLAIDAAATMAGAVCGTSTTTAYIESAAGIEQGGRTGLTSIVTGLFFLAAIPFVPLVAIVPAYATAPALIMVGLFMMKEARKIDFSHLVQALPAFIIIVMIALSYSISTGLAFGFIAHTLITIIDGNAKKIKPALWLITVLSIIFFCI